VSLPPREGKRSVVRATAFVVLRMAPAALGLVAVGLVACGRGGAPSQDALQEALREGPLTAREARGKQLFAERCATCHGVEGRGDGQNASRVTPVPPDMSMTLREVSPADRRRIVVEGSAAVGRSALCPPRGPSLRPEDVDALLAWLEVVARLPPAATDESAGPPRWRRKQSAR
jgi:mono/diheme cytochrome c family protein